MELHGKTALITGGALRVGKAISRALAWAGANVVINYSHSAAEADQTAAEAQALGVAALPIQTDVADPAQVLAMVAQAQARFGAVDVLVNSASLFMRTPLPLADVADWRHVIGIGLDGAFYCANAVAPQMLARGEGAIVKNRDLMGATDPKKAAAGTIRADFAESIDANAVHGSDAAETAAVEIAFFFPGTDVFAR